MLEIISKNLRLSKKQVKDLIDVITKESEVSFKIIDNEVQIICKGETQLEKLSTEGLSEKIAILWNSQKWELSKLKRFSSQRMAKFKRLLKDRRELSDLGEWVEIINRISSSDFLQGDNDRGWRADFDWLLQKDSIDKLFDGRYDNRDGLSRNVKAALALYKQQSEI